MQKTAKFEYRDKNSTSRNGEVLSGEKLFPAVIELCGFSLASICVSAKPQTLTP
jgi:hypothetical protein